MVQMASQCEIVPLSQKPNESAMYKSWAATNTTSEKEKTLVKYSECAMED